MTALEAKETLAKMVSKFKKERPAWYENASEEEKAAFEAKNAYKIEALEYAVALLSCETRVFKLKEMISKIGDHIDGVIAGYLSDKKGD